MALHNFNMLASVPQETPKSQEQSHFSAFARVKRCSHQLWGSAGPSGPAFLHASSSSFCPSHSLPPPCRLRGSPTRVGSLAPRRRFCPAQLGFSAGARTPAPVFDIFFGETLYEARSRLTLMARRKGRGARPCGIRLLKLRRKESIRGGYIHVQNHRH